MPIQGIDQPEYIIIDAGLRLKAYDGVFEFALSWYQNKDSLELIDGKGKAIPYTLERLKKMYEYLDKRGELYFIEKKENDGFIPVGDVTLWQEDMPIVIAKDYRSQGIGKKTVQRLIRRAKELGFKRLAVKEIYGFNLGSQKLFLGCGFKKSAPTDSGASYVLNLN